MSWFTLEDLLHGTSHEASWTTDSNAWHDGSGLPKTDPHLQLKPMAIMPATGWFHQPQDPRIPMSFPHLRLRHGCATPPWSPLLEPWGSWCWTHLSRGLASDWKGLSQTPGGFASIWLPFKTTPTRYPGKKAKTQSYHWIWVPPWLTRKKKQNKKQKR